MKIAIIGAGPTGLAVAGRLSEANIEYDLFEKSDSVGHSWRNHYDRLKLHTVKHLSNLPYKPFPDNYPKYVSRDEFIAYLESYAAHFGMKPRLNCAIRQINRKDNQWHMQWEGGEGVYDEVVIATGVNHIPKYPEKDLWQTYQGMKIHSKDYRNPKEFLGKKVLVVGMGNTGAEIALDLANSEIDVALSVRSKVNIVPLELLGRSSQETALKLEKLPLKVARVISRIAQRLAIGDLSRFGLPRPDLAPVEQLKALGRTPVIDLGTVRKIKEGKIKVYPQARAVNGDSVEFQDGRNKKVDAVIFCTGYKPALASMLGDLSKELGPEGYPQSVVGKDQLKGMYFVGFDLKTAGGILRVINQQSEEVLEHLMQRE